MQGQCAYEAHAVCIEASADWTVTLSKTFTAGTSLLSRKHIQSVKSVLALGGCVAPRWLLNLFSLMTAICGSVACLSVLGIGGMAGGFMNGPSNNLLIELKNNWKCYIYTVLFLCLNLMRQQGGKGIYLGVFFFSVSRDLRSPPPCGWEC